MRVERTIDIARCQSPVLKICSPTSLLCGLNNLASSYVALFGLNCAVRHATMQPNMQPKVSPYLTQYLAMPPSFSVPSVPSSSLIISSAWPGSSVCVLRPLSWAQSCPSALPTTPSSRQRFWRVLRHSFGDVSQDSPVCRSSLWMDDRALRVGNLVLQELRLPALCGRPPV